MFSSLSRPGLSELPARADFNAIDLVKPTPPAASLAWTPAGVIELRPEELGPERGVSMRFRRTWDQQSAQSRIDVLYGVSLWPETSCVIEPGDTFTIASVNAVNPRWRTRQKIGDTIQVRRPGKVLSPADISKATLDILRKAPAELRPGEGFRWRKDETVDCTDISIDDLGGLLGDPETADRLKLRMVR